MVHLKGFEPLAFWSVVRRSIQLSYKCLLSCDPLARRGVTGLQLAEGERFELSVQISSYDGLANRWFQPLTHPSKDSSWDYGLAEGEGFEPPVEFPLLQFSRLSPSTARPTLLKRAAPFDKCERECIRLVRACQQVELGGILRVYFLFDDWRFFRFRAVRGQGSSRGW